jgi:hypothetical protein
MSFTQNNIPYTVIMEPVTVQNGWSLILYNNVLGIRKNNTPYYYTVSSVYHFGNVRPILDTTPNLVYLGEYKPVMMDSNYFASLPLNINDNLFFVNQLTRIVYIKPKELVIIIPQTMPYDFKLYESFTFAGNYNPYLNSTSNSNKVFADVIPKVAHHKTAKVETSERSHLDPIQNTLTDYPYPNMPQTQIMPKQVFNITNPNSNVITFIIPFLNNISKNIASLTRTIESILTNVIFCKIILVVNSTNIQLPESISKKVTIVPYTKYVGRLGYENKLNMKMDNGYDLASFYNFLITNLVKTQLYTIWNYNWTIEEWHDSIVTSRCFSVANCYIDGEERFKSNKFGRIGYILSGKMKYSTSSDGIDISVHGIGTNSIDYKIRVFCNYDILDYEDRKSILLYGNEIELKTYFENRKNNLSCNNFVQKII